MDSDCITHIQTNGFVKVDVMLGLLICTGTGISIKYDIGDNSTENERNNPHKKSLYVRSDKPDDTANSLKKEGILYFPLVYPIRLSKIEMSGNSLVDIKMSDDVLNKENLKVVMTHSSFCVMRNFNSKYVYAQLSGKSHLVGKSVVVEDLVLNLSSKSKVLLRVQNNLKAYLKGQSNGIILVSPQTNKDDLKLKDKASIELKDVETYGSRVITVESIEQDRKKKEEEEKMAKMREMIQNRLIQMREQFQIQVTGNQNEVVRYSSSDDGDNVDSGSSSDSDSYDEEENGTAVVDTVSFSHNITTRTKTNEKKKKDEIVPSAMNDTVAKDNQTSCKICLTNSVKTCTIPCYHSVLCLACSRRLRETSEKEKKAMTCIICRGKIEKIVEIFS